MPKQETVEYDLEVHFVKDMELSPFDGEGNCSMVFGGEVENKETCLIFGRKEAERLHALLGLLLSGGTLQ